MNRLSLLLLATTLLTAACAQLDDVEDQWGETMKRFKLSAIFPISEDLQPGDVLLDVPVDDEWAGPRPQVQRLGSIPVAELMTLFQKQARQRLLIEGIKLPKPGDDKPADKTADKPTASSLSAVATVQPGTTVTTTTRIAAAAEAPKKPETKPKPDGKPDPNAPTPPDIRDADAAPVGKDPLVRLRRVAVPGIIAARVKNWQIAGAGPIGRLAISLGLSGNGATAVQIKLKQLSTLELDRLAALQSLDQSVEKWLRSNSMTPARLLNLVYASNAQRALEMCQNRPARPNDQRALIRVVNRVMYAHQIQYEYTRNSNVAGRLALDISQVPSDSASRALVPSATAASTAQPGVTTATTSGAAIQGAAAALNASQAALAASSPSTAGIRTSFGVGTFGDISLDETYAAPMAVGYNTIADYPVREALIALPGNAEQTVQQQVDAAKNFCEGVFKDLKVGGDRSAIARLIEENKSNLPASGLPALRSVGPQLRDFKSRPI